MKKILILGANSYIGTSFHNYLTTKYHGQYQTDIVSLRGTDWKNRDWSGYDSVLNVTGKAHADISSLTEEQKKEYYAVNCDLAVEAARKAIADGVAQYIYFSSTIRDIHGHLCCDLSGLIHGYHITTQQSGTDPILHHAVHRHLRISHDHTDRLRIGILLATAII